MNRRQYSLIVALALIAGLVGGMVSSQFFVGQPVLAEKKPDGQEIEESEIIDSRQLKKDLGVQKVVRAESFELYDSQGLKVADLIQGGGFVRFTMWQSGGGTLSLSVKGTESDISSRNPNTDNVLFIENSDSGLVMDMGRLLGEKIWFSFYKDQPHIQLFDKEGRKRAVLGTTDLKNMKTGSTEIRAPSSLVLFDEKGSVVWKAP